MIDRSVISEIVKSNLRSSGELKQKIDNISRSMCSIAIVLEYDKDPESFSVKVISPYINLTRPEIITASPLKTSSGELIIPEVGETVLLYAIGGAKDDDVEYYYTTHTSLTATPFAMNKPYSEYFNNARVGFTRGLTQTFKGYAGGRYIKKVLEKRGLSKIINSSGTFVIYQDEEDSLLEIRGADDYTIKMQVGDNGNVKIGFCDDVNDVQGTGSANIEIDSGLNGSVDIKSMGGDINIETTTGDVVINTTTGLLKFKTNDDIELDPGSGKKVWIKGDLYVDGDIKWNYSTTPTTASTHIHGTGVGPSAAPNPGS